MWTFLVSLLIALPAPVVAPGQSSYTTKSAAEQQQVVQAEQAAIGALRAINSAQASFRSACGHGLYAPGLVELGKPAVAGGEGFLTAALAAAASVTRAGYTITMASSEGAVATSKQSCNGLPAGTLVAGYYITATPAPGSGSRYFVTNTKGIILQGSVPLKVTDEGSEGTPIR